MITLIKFATSEHNSSKKRSYVGEGYVWINPQNISAIKSVKFYADTFNTPNTIIYIDDNYWTIKESIQDVFKKLGLAIEEEES